MNHASDTTNKPSPDTQQMLDSLKQAVKQALEKKKCLGQYAVIWENGQPVTVGKDAPEVNSCKKTENT